MLSVKDLSAPEEIAESGVRLSFHAASVTPGRCWAESSIRCSERASTMSDYGRQGTKVETMRHRQDFYTLCPGCETRVELTLAAKLQAARAGCSCECHTCRHEWICIQEWVYRDEPIDHTQPVAAHQPGQPALPSHATGAPQAPPATVAAAQPPRPHLPTFQPPQPAAPAAQQQPAASATEPHLAADQPSEKPVPTPHAWSWERSAQQQPSRSQDSQPGAGR